MKKYILALILVLCCSAFAQVPRHFRSTTGQIYIINIATGDTAKVQSLTGDFDLLNVGLKIRSTTAIDSFSVVGDTLKLWVGSTQYNAFLPGAAPGGLSSESAWTIVLNNSASSATPLGVKISALTDRTSFGAGDKIMIEESTGELRKIDFSDLPGAGGGISNIVEDVTPQLGGDLDANTFDIQFDDATGIRDDSDNEQLIFQKTATAINHIEVTNAAAGGEPLIAAVGGDTDVSLTLDGKGTGTVRTLSSNLDITGNIIVSGTVDGKDIATNAGMLNESETIASDWVNTANPWAENEIVSTVIVETDIDTYAELDAIVADETLSHSSLSESLTNKTVNSFTNDIFADHVHEEIRNESGGAMAVGDAVYISGFSVGQTLPLGTLADASGSGTMPAVAILMDATLANNATGNFISVGTVTGMNTNSWEVGDDLYISETGTTGNTLTNTKPTGTALIQKVAEVLRKHATLGVIEVFGAGRTNDLPNIASANFWLGNASGVPTAVTMSSEATMDNAGAVTLADGVTVTNWALGTPASMVGTNLSGTGASFTAGISTLATVTDNEATVETNAIIFAAGADLDGGTLGLESDGDFTYTPNTGNLSATQFGGIVEASLVDKTAGETVTGNWVFDGNISVGNTTTSAGVLTLLEDDDAGSNFASFQVPALAANTAYILPDAFGSAGFQLTDAAGDGILSWAAASAAAAHAGTITWTGTSILESGVAFQFGDASDATLTHTFANTGTNITVAYSSALFTFSHGLTLSAGNITQAAGTTLFMGGLLDAIGDVDMDYGSADIDDHTFVSDGGTTIIDGGITALGEDLGSATAEWNDLFLNDGGVIQLGNDQDVTITHVADTGILFALDRQIQFGDAGVFIESDDDSFLDLDADGGIRLNAATTSTGTITATGSFIIGAADMAEADLEKLDGITNGTAAASKALVLDAALSIATLNILTADSLIANVFDAPGDVALKIGSDDVDAVTIETDGTGDDEVVLPDASINTDEITGFAITEPKLGYFEWSKFIVVPDTVSTVVDTLWFPTHYSATVTVVYIKAISDLDDMSVHVVKASENGADATLVDIVTTSTDITNAKFWGEETSITAGTIAADDWIGLTGYDENANYFSILVTGTR